MRWNASVRDVKVFVWTEWRGLGQGRPKPDMSDQKRWHKQLAYATAPSSDVPSYSHDVCCRCVEPKLPDFSSVAHAAAGHALVCKSTLLLATGEISLSLRVLEMSRRDAALVELIELEVSSAGRLSCQHSRFIAIEI